MIRFFLFICCFITIQGDDPIIVWDASNKLSWTDFKAAPQNNVSAVAITASGLTFGFSIKETDTKVVSFTTEVYAHFYPEKSWYKPNLADKHILGHEQLHFDITELHARKFRHQISLLKVSNTIKKDLNNLHVEINKALAAMQDSYDVETNHSRNVEAQAKWDIYIAKELEKLSIYKVTN